MDLEATIEQSILCYPSLNRWRSDVLEHLFYVIGNGYEWQDGQLVHLGPEPSYISSSKLFQDDYVERVSSRIAQTDPEGAEKFRRDSAERDARQDATEAAIRAQVGWRSKFLGPPKSIFDTGLTAFKRPTADTLRMYPGGWSLYPESDKYSFVNNLPPDIRPDWLAGALETRRWYNYYMSHPHSRWAKTISDAEQMNQKEENSWQQ